MEPLDFTVYFLFTLHVAYWVVNVWAFYSFSKLLVLNEAPSTKKYMLVFKAYEMTIVILSFLMVIFESYFIFNFFVDVELYYYEYMLLVDVIVFKALVVKYVKKEGHSDG